VVVCIILIVEKLHLKMIYMNIYTDRKKSKTCYRKKQAGYRSFIDLFKGKVSGSIGGSSEYYLIRASQFSHMG
jgi:hypothetical protein